MIRIKNLNKYYNKNKSNEIHVIDNTSIELPTSGFITFLGHSGSGKTTLLNVIGGLDKATGEIEYDDISFKKYSPSKIDKFRSRSIGYVFQKYNLLLTETVYDNLRIALELIGVTNKDEQDKRIEYTLKAVGMFKFRKKLAANLSGGQQQRVSIARALIKRAKIIIADEPTGNLDSKNSIEIMNILKKLSKKVLVLLVTHEERLANFYSDTIFELKDGKIIDSFTNTSKTTLEEEPSNVIYLKDLDKKEENSSIGNLTIYSDNSKELKADISFIVKNGTLYLKSSEPIKLIDSRIKVVDDHYKPMDMKRVDDFEYDTSWYNDEKEDKKRFKKFINLLKNSLINFKNVGKKQKFLYVCLAFIGCIMSIAFASLANGTMIDLSNYSYSKKINTILVDDKTSYSKIIKEAAREKEIGELYYLIPSVSINYFESILYNYSISVSEYVTLASSEQVKPDLKCGSLPKERNEIVVSESFYNKIAKETGRKEDEILGLEINASLRVYDDTLVEFKICGISKNDNLFGYVTDDVLNSLNLSRSKGYIGYEINGENIYTQYAFRQKDMAEYQIIEGNDITGDDQVLANKSHYLNQEIYIDNLKYTVVGIYDSKFADINTLIVDFPFSSLPYECITLRNDSKLFEITEGRYPNSKEALASKYSNLQLNETVNIYGYEYVIVGFYDGGSELGFNYIINDVDYYQYQKIDSNVAFTIYNFEAFNNRLKNNNAQLVTLDERVKQKTLNNASDVLKGFFIVFTVCVIAASLFVYFIMRSKMLSDIYSIGVYRSLGASRFRINRKYIVDIIVLTTFTGLIGYLLGTLLYFWLALVVNGIFSAIISQNVLMFSGLYVLIGALAMYFIMLVFGMLPIVTLQMKTPSEICSKYDI